MKVEASSDALDVTVRDFVSGQKVFNRYTLNRILGRGGMGVVWLARDDVLERDVALKFLPELVVFDRTMLSDLKRETNRSLELTHKNIVRIYDFVHDETSGCISMEYVDGDTLSNLRADHPKRAFQTHELTDWMKQLCDALDYAHNHARVVHRDLKPSNLMLKRHGELKVADFGIARSLSDSVSMLTMGRHTSGTLVYMSPQQLDGERGSHLDDIYSVGATFYELLTSKPPFYSGNIDRQIHERIPPPMNNRRVELEIEGDPIDESWEKLVAACLQKDPARRPQSALEIVGLLTASAPKTPRRMTDWFAFPSRKTDQKTGLRPAPPSAKTPPKAEVHPQPVREKKFRLAVARTIATGKDKVRGAGLAAVSASKATIRDASRALAAGATVVCRATAAVAASSANVLFAAGHALLIITKETVRGTALVMMPAAAAAACIWYFAIRPPPKKPVAELVTKTQLSTPPQVQPSAAPMGSNIANVTLIPPLATQNLPTSTPPLVRQGGLFVDTAPAGATIMIDGSATKTSPATISNLPVGRHQMQITLEGYNTEEMPVEINDGQVTSLGLITLHAREQSPIAAEAKSKEEPPTRPSPAKNRAKKKPVIAAKPERSAPAAAQEAAATPAPPPAKITSKPAATPEQKRRRPEFEGSAPGG